MKNVELRAQILEIRAAADFYQFHHLQNGALMNGAKLASFSVNAAECIFSVGAAQ